MRSSSLCSLVLVSVLLLVGCGDDDDSDAVGDDAPVAADTSGEDEEFEYSADDGDAPAEFTLVNGDLVVVGVIDSGTPDDFAAALEDHPDVTTLVLALVPGSADDDANLELARMVRDEGLTTVVPANGLVASGGTDLFLAGVDRDVEPGACLGVHSWATGDGTEGRDLDDDDPEHDAYLDYYDTIGIDTEFYWFTLEAAPAEDMYWMTADDAAAYAIDTDGDAEPAAAGVCERRPE